MSFFRKIGREIGKFFFGSSPKIRTEIISRWSPEQQALFKRMFRDIRAGMRGWTQSPEYLRYKEFLEGYEPWYRGLVQEAYSPEAATRYFRDVLEPTWEASILPRLRAEYAGPGYWGSARAEAVRKSLSDLGRMQGEMLYGTEMARRQALMQLAEALPNVYGTLSTLGTPAANPYMQAAYQMLGLDPYYVLGGMTQGQPGFFHSLAGGLGQGLGTILGMKIPI